MTEIGRSFEERSRESGVDRGDDGLARRVCLLFRLSSVCFSLFLEQKCSLKNTRASISRFSSDELSISTF